MVKYPKPIKLWNHTSIRTETLIEKKKSWLYKLLNPKPKKKNELQEAYQKRYDETYRKEREEYLVKKAEKDAKKKANRDNSLMGFIVEIITGGRNKP